MGMSSKTPPFAQYVLLPRGQSGKLAVEPQDLVLMTSAIALPYPVTNSNTPRNQVGYYVKRNR